jgi:hypothetical protein
MLAEAAIGNAGVWAGPALLTLVGIGLGLARGRWVPWVQGGCLIGAAVLGAALLFPWNVLIPLVVLLALVGLLGVYRASKASSSPPRVRLILELRNKRLRFGIRNEDTEAIPAGLLINLLVPKSWKPFASVDPLGRRIAAGQVMPAEYDLLGPEDEPVPTLMWVFRTDHEIAPDQTDLAYFDISNAPSGKHPVRIALLGLGVEDFVVTLDETTGHEGKSPAVEALRRLADEHASVKILVFPVAQVSRARQIADLFQLAGWKTDFDATPREPRNPAAHVSGIEVRGFNEVLVDAVRDALVEAEVPGLKTSVLRADAEESDPIRITVGHP